LWPQYLDLIRRADPAQKKIAAKAEFKSTAKQTIARLLSPDFDSSQKVIIIVFSYKLQSFMIGGWINVWIFSLFKNRSVITMIYLVYIQTFGYALLGWLAGLLINHAADILPQRETVRQLPACSRCRTLRPVKAWSALAAYARGDTRCFRCGQLRLNLNRALVVELVTPVFFAFLWGRYGPSLELAFTSLYTAILILITVTDLEHRLIFNVVVLPATVAGLAASFFDPSLSWKVAVLGGAVGFILSYLAALFSRGGLGGGDVTLSAFLGVIVGFPYILLNLLLGVFLGGLTASLLLMSRRVGLKTYIPYGPFLTITGWIMLIWRTEIWNYYF
jgi:leader peptidase (prepilin peptidase)/N-methyltransferase